MIPEVDYFDDLPVQLRRSSNTTLHQQFANNRMNGADRLSQTQLNKDGLVIPRKPANPCIESMERRDLHRELLFSQKMGKPVLNQKTELQKAMQKHREHQTKKEVEMERQSTRSSLEKVLEQRARRLEEMERSMTGDMEEERKSSEPNEFLRMHAKLRGRVEATAASQ